MPEKESIEAKIGSYAPDFRLMAHTGKVINLSDYRNRRNVILFFVREYTCFQCRSHATQLGRLYNKFQEANCEILVIIGSDLETARKYAELIKAPFPVLADPQREVYHTYELEKYFALFQRTASIVVDTLGVVKYLKRTTVPNVWLQESRELLGFVYSLPDHP